MCESWWLSDQMVGKLASATLPLDHIRNYDVDALSYILDHRDALAVSHMACEYMIEFYKGKRQKMKEFLKRISEQF